MPRNDATGVLYVGGALNKGFEQIAELRHDPVLRAECADRAYQCAQLKFTASQMVSEYEKVYSEITTPARVA